VAKRKESESHAGVTKATPHETTEYFEFGGHKLPHRGTSGPQKLASRTAEGMPVRHDVRISAKTAREPTLGAGQVESRSAAGRPVQHASTARDATSGPTGSGQTIGGPVRRA
jgi:hypothetical protein